MTKVNACIIIVVFLAKGLLVPNNLNILADMRDINLCENFSNLYVEKTQGKNPNVLVSEGNINKNGLKTSRPKCFESIDIVGIRLITFSSNKDNLRPFNYPVGYTLGILCKFPTAVTNVKEVVIDKCITNKGESILPRRSGKSLILRFPKLSLDKKYVLFEAEFVVPNKDAKYIEEISGYVDCIIAGSTREVDLQFSEIVSGAKGERFGAVIKKIGKEKTFQLFGEETSIEENIIDFKINCPKDSIKSVKIYNNNNKIVSAEQRSSSSIFNQISYRYVLKESLSKDGRIALEIYENIQTYRIPFKIKNISFLGQPANQFVMQ